MTDSPGDPPQATADLSSDLTPVLARMGGVLLSAQTVATVLELVTRLAVETIPGSAGAGVTLVDARGKRTTAASDPMVERADELQYEFDQGPCLSAWRDQVPVRVDDIEVDARWPAWTAAARPLGLRAVLSTPLVAAEDRIGAIKVYSFRPGTYDDRSEQLLSLFAQQAAVLLANTQNLNDARQLSGRLTRALSLRDTIGAAKGILMAEGAADDQTAFSMLVATSQQTNVPLHEVARQLIASVTARHAGGP